MKLPKDEVAYGYISKQFPTTNVFFDSYETALNSAIHDQPKHRPFYMIKATRHFEFCGIVEKGEAKKNCPICDYPFDMCQCRFGGNAHPDRSKRARVVADHIYLLSDEQIEHLKQVQKWWAISYGDEEMSQILKELKSEGEK